MNKNVADVKINKKDKMLHPEMNLVKVVMTNGEEWCVMMNASANSTKLLSVDAHSHPAWQGTENKSQTTQAQKFRNKYSKKS